MGQQSASVSLLLWIIVCFDNVFIGLSAPDGQYLGCFKEKTNLRSFIGHVGQSKRNLTRSLCAEVCYSKGFLYSGTHARTYCFCGDKSPRSTSKVSEDQCSESCSGKTTEKCGGNATMSVMSTGIPDHPETGGYLGCFQDFGRTFSDYSSTFEKTNTPRRCMNACLQLGYKYAGVQNSNECKCGNVKINTEFALDAEECEWPCPGDSSENCGGHARLALYSTYVANERPTPPKKKKFFVENENKANWHEALMACVRKNTRLATIDNKEEFEEIKQIIGELGRRLSQYWTSGSDEDSEGKFIWTTTGKQLSSTSEWWQRQLHRASPNGGDKENCVDLSEENEWQGYGLDDKSCSNKAYYICESYTE